ncbi:hypothetical protein ACS5PN_09460 [Roseateles sp. NT4]|uniref:hypothetical protein n=1 Tax=Roseateles sp. NT4 TaxID=3453715 RepID=UPI003EEE54AD
MSITKTMGDIPQTIESTFAAAGWTRCSYLDQSDECQSAEAFVAAILAQFSGLHVGQCGPGTQQAASDIDFYRAARPEVAAIVAPWQSLVGNCEAFATAHHDHMILLVNDDGAYFAFTDPDDRLYRFNGGFGDFMEALLLGYPFGAALPRDAQPFAAADGFAVR